MKKFISELKSFISEQFHALIEFLGTMISIVLVLIIVLAIWAIKDRQSFKKNIFPKRYYEKLLTVEIDRLNSDNLKRTKNIGALEIAGEYEDQINLYDSLVSFYHSILKDLLQKRNEKVFQYFSMDYNSFEAIGKDIPWYILYSETDLSKENLYEASNEVEFQEQLISLQEDRINNMQSFLNEINQGNIFDFKDSIEIYVQEPNYPKHLKNEMQHRRSEYVKSLVESNEEIE